MHSLSLYLMAFLYVAAGVTHFLRPRMYQRIMPPWLPWHQELVWISGVIEIVLGILVLWPPTRHLAAWGIIVLLVAVFPANVQMALTYWQKSKPGLWIALFRLPLQGLLIWWAYSFTK